MGPGPALQHQALALDDDPEIFDLPTQPPVDLRLDLLDDPDATALAALMKSLIIHDGPATESPGPPPGRPRTTRVASNTPFAAPLGVGPLKNPLIAVDRSRAAHGNRGQDEALPPVRSQALGT